jgi:ribonuclease T1
MMFTGGGMMLGGAGIDIAGAGGVPFTFGGSLALEVPGTAAIAIGAGVLVWGTMNIQSGLQTLTHAMSMSSSTSGGGGGPAAPSSGGSGSQAGSGQGGGTQPVGSGGVGSSIPKIDKAKLPPEAQQTMDLAKKGGPFPYQQDGTPFKNLPDKTTGAKPLPVQSDPNYYHEYTVATPGAPNRGVQRIVTGNNGEAYYTNDHYTTFWEIK